MAQLRKEAEEMAFQGYDPEEIFVRMDRLNVSYDKEEILDLVLLANEGKLVDPKISEDGDETMNFRSRGGQGDDSSASGDETQR